jgi:CRISPR/Cas system-associated protein Csm6
VKRPEARKTLVLLCTTVPENSSVELKLRVELKRRVETKRREPLSLALWGIATLRLKLFDAVMKEVRSNVLVVGTCDDPVKIGVFVKIRLDVNLSDDLRRNDDENL